MNRVAYFHILVILNDLIAKIWATNWSDGNKYLPFPLWIKYTSVIPGSPLKRAPLQACELRESLTVTTTVTFHPTQTQTFFSQLQIRVSMLI